MSQELIDAAACGNITLVKLLLTNPAININFIGQFYNPIIQTSEVLRIVQASALTAAIIKGHEEIALYLLQQGAKVEVDEINPAGYFFNDALFKNAIILTNVMAISMTLLKVLLSKCRDINPHVIWTVGGYHFNVMNKFTDETRCRLPDKYARMSYFLYEAVLRNDTVIIRDNTPQASHYQRLAISEIGFQAYIEGRPFSANEAVQANNGIDYAVSANIINPTVGAQLKKLIERNIIFNIELALFPKELQNALKLSQKSLAELYSELQHCLFPENSFNTQDPKNLRTFLNMDEANILMRLNYCANETSENPATLLLGEILLRFHAAKINVEGKSEAWLDERQQRTCLSVLNKFYNMTDIEKVLMNAHRYQFSLLKQVTLQNQTLVASVKELHTKLDKLMTETPLRKNESAIEKPAFLNMFSLTPKQ